MKKILAMILAVMMFLTLSFSAFATEAEVSLDDMAAQIRSFEEAHPEMKEQFHQMVQDVSDIATEEFRTAFSRIQSRFKEILDANRQEIGITDADHEVMREKVELQASLVNAGFIAHLMAAEEQMIAILHGTEYTADETDVIAVLDNLIAEKSDFIDDGLITKLSQIVEKAKSEHNGGLDAWYKEISAVPELNPGEAGNDSRPPMPEPQSGETRPPMQEPQPGETRPPMPEGEEGKGGPEGEEQQPFNDHFTAIREELGGAFRRINERLQALAKEAPEKYQISEDTAAEATDLLHQLFNQVNKQIMEQLGNMDKMTRGRMMNP